jgi:toxin ParE1/3/4
MPMSSPQYTIKFSAKAKKDLIGIIAYTIEVWGDNQALVYRAIIDKSVAMIVQNPEIGRKDLPPYFYVKSGEHYIFYKLKNNKISVSRILHNKMDFTRHLP